MDKPFVMYARVFVAAINEYGEIHKIRDDSRGENIYTVFLDVPTEVPHGIYYARHWELLPL